MSEKPVKQLIAGADSQTEFYPKQLMQNVLDGEAGENLYAYLSKFNHINVGYVASSTAAYNAIPEIYRKIGFIITYYLNEKPTTKQFIGTKEDAGNDNWSVDSYWQLVDGIGEVDTNSITLNQLSKEVLDLIGNSKKVNIVNYPDGEDLTQVDVCGGNSKNKINVLKFADKECNSANFSGLGRKYLRKNLVEVEEDDGTKVTKNVLTQEMINTANTRYIIQYDYDLNGAEITIPERCILDFQGGSLKNGTINLNNCVINADKNIFDTNIILKGYIYGDLIKLGWYKLTYWNADTWIEYQKGNTIDIPTENAEVFNRLFNECKYDIELPVGIIPFSSPITYVSSSTTPSFEKTIYGAYTKRDPKTSCLIFPKTEGFHFGGEKKRYSLIGATFKNFTVESKKECFYFTDTYNENSVLWRCLFENLNLSSKDSDCFYCDFKNSHFENIFSDISFETNNSHGLANGIGNLQFHWINITDTHNFVGRNANNPPVSISPSLYVFKNMDVFLYNSNLTEFGIKYIVMVDPSYHNTNCHFVAKNCNFESIKGPIIYSPSVKSIWNIDVQDCTVVHSIDPKEYKALFYCRFGKIISFPDNIRTYTSTLEYDCIAWNFTNYIFDKTIKIIDSNLDTLQYNIGYSVTHSDLVDSGIENNNEQYNIDGKFLKTSRMGFRSSFAEKVMGLILDYTDKYINPANVKDIILKRNEDGSLIIAVGKGGVNKQDYIIIPTMYNYSSADIEYLNNLATVSENRGATCLLDGKPMILFNNKWKYIKAINYEAKEFGTSSERPNKNIIETGFQYFDTTINKPIWWTGSKWVDATGVDV